VGGPTETVRFGDDASWRCGVGKSDAEVRLAIAERLAVAWLVTVVIGHHVASGQMLPGRLARSRPLIPRIGAA